MYNQLVNWQFSTSYLITYLAPKFFLKLIFMTCVVLPQKSKNNLPLAVMKKKQ